ncbi:MAG TPA: hypothetical protein VGC92_01570 [Phenylobacterium sp.]
MAMGRKLALLVGVAVMAAGVVAAQPGKKAARPAAPKAGAPAAAASASGEQKVTGPVAVYWMSASTQSGFGLPGAGGGSQRPSAMDLLRMMQGGGGAQHNLLLQLGSSEAPQGGPPHAEHQVPTGLGVGPSVPLVTPEVQKVEVHEDERPQIPREYQKPKGRMLIFWGCGEHAAPGQPLVIDFAQMTPEKLASGQMPANFAAMMRGFDIQRVNGPAFNRNTTYGDWPNAKSSKRVPSEGSLVGDHVITGDYSPEIRFTLDQEQDFLGPLNLTSNAKLPSGAVQLGWNTVPNAQAYIASMIGGGGQADTIVMWTSSETQAAAFAMPEYLSPGDISRLVANRSLMGPEATSCAVPQEAANAVQGGLVQMVAYGREANFVYPPRPADRHVAWNRQWEVKVRYRSATGGLLGQPMPSMGGRGRGGPAGGSRDQTGQQQPPPDPAAARRRAILNGLGGLIPH